MTLRGKEVLKGLSGYTFLADLVPCVWRGVHVAVGHREQLFTSVPIKLSYGKEENYDFLQNNLVLWEKKKSFPNKAPKKRQQESSHL